MALRVAGSSPVIHPTFSALCRGRLRAAQRISQKAGAFFMCRPLRLLYLSACCAFLRFFSLYRLFLFLYARLSGFFPVCALYCIPSVLPALSGRSLPSLSGLRFLTAALSLFALLFVPFVCRPSCAHFAIAHFLFLSLGYLLRFPGAACAPFCGFSAVGTDDAESILSSGCGSVGRAGGLGAKARSAGFILKNRGNVRKTEEKRAFAVWPTPSKAV